MRAIQTMTLGLLAALPACGGDPGERAPPFAVTPAPAVRPAPVEPIEIDPATVATRLVDLPSLSYRPLIRSENEPELVSSPPFRIEECAVTNAQFLAFVRADPKWSRSRVSRLFADALYLAHWRGDFEPGNTLLGSPVTHVSWFATRAYARWIGRRLPSVAEWEAVAAASETAVDGRGEPGFTQRILDWYGRPTPAVPAASRSTFVNAHGVWDLHGLIWEWVEDFNTALVTGESRGDTGLERNLFCGAGSIGAADPADYAAFMRYAFRSSLVGNYTVKNLGFRCAADRAEGDTR